MFSWNKIAPWALFALAFILRLLVIIDYTDVPAFGMPVLEEKNYHESVRALMGLSTQGQEIFHGSFLYTISLFILYQLKAGSLIFIQIIQAILDSFSCVLVFLAASRWKFPKAGLLAAGFMVIYGPSLFFVTQILPTVQGTFLFALTLYVLSNPVKNNLAYLMAQTICFILATLYYPAFLIPVLVYLIYRITKDFRTNQNNQKHPSPQSTTKLLATAKFSGYPLLGLYGFCIILMGAGAHFNGASSALFPKSISLDYFLNNHPDVCETVSRSFYQSGFVPVANQEYQAGRLVGEYPQKKPEESSKSPISNFRFKGSFFQEGLVNQLQNPLGAIKIFMYRSLQFFQSREFAKTEDPYFYTKWMPGLSVFLNKWGKWGWPLILIWPLAIMVFLSDFKRIPPELWLFTGSYGLVLILFDPHTELRTTFIPGLSLLAGLGLRKLSQIKTESFPVKLEVVGLLILGFVICTRPVQSCMENKNYASQYYYSMGKSFLDQQKFAFAEDHFSEAIKEDSRNGLAWYYQGVARYSQGKSDEALDSWDRALAIYPGFQTALDISLSTLLEEKRVFDAITLVNRKIHQPWQRSQLITELANTLAKQGDFNNALILYKAGLPVSKLNQVGLHFYAESQANLGNMMAAKYAFKLGSEKFSDQILFAYRLAMIHSLQENFDQAFSVLKLFLKENSKKALYYFDFFELQIDLGNKEVAQQVVNILEQIDTNLYNRAKNILNP